MYPTLFMEGERRRPWEYESWRPKATFRCHGTDEQLMEAVEWTRENFGPGGPETWQYNWHPTKRLIWFSDRDAAFHFRMRWC